MRTEFSDLKTRGNRKYEFVIFDEVDNTFIDELNKIAMISTQIPSMDYLIPIYVIIWNEVNKLCKHIHHYKGEEYFIFSEHY